MPEPSVVFEDRWLLVVSKPVGQPTQGRADGQPGLFEQLKRQHRYVGLHHRLDQPTSGLVLFTLDKAANKAVTEALREHQLHRSYQALLSGRARNAEWAWPVDKRPANTRVDVAGYANGISAVWCTLGSGRKHQIRIHASMAGTPVLGDRRYGDSRFERLALHAARLQWTHPMTGEPLDLLAPLPEPMAEVWRNCVAAAP